MTLKELINRHGSDIDLWNILEKLERLYDLESELYCSIIRVKEGIKRDIEIRTNAEGSDEDPNIYDYKELMNSISDVEEAIENLSDKFYLLIGLVRDQRNCLKPIMEEYKERTKNLQDLLIKIISEENDEQ